MPDIARLTLQEFKTKAKAAKKGEAVDAIVPYAMGAQCKAVDGEDRVREFIASTGSVDREQDSLSVDGWVLGNFNKSGVFLWAHEWATPPVGDPFATFVEGESLKTRVRFPAEDFPHPYGTGFGHTVMRMYDERLLKGVSVGFRPLEWNFNEERGGMAMDFGKQELMEISAVPVPANAEALHVARSLGIDTGPVVAWAETVRDKSGLWVSKDDITALLDQAAQKSISVPSPKVEAGSENDQAEETDPVEPEPDLETKEADPETKDVEPEPTEADVYEKAMEAAETAESKIVQGLKQAAEIIAKRGRVLSGKNEDDLRRAYDLVGSVLSQVADQDQDDKPTSRGKAIQVDADDLEVVEDPITARQFEKLVSETITKQLAKVTGRLPA